jgi:uncharacterized repeat protein (TIGR03803 family)
MRKLVVVSIALVTSATITVYAQTYTALYDLGTKSNDPNGPAWAGAIAQGRNGQLYTASEGSVNGKAFSFTTSGAVTIRRSFNGTDGGQPYGGLNLGTDGLYFGATELGGTNGLGTVFKMTAGGGLTTLYNFTGASDGGYPWTAPIESVAGAFYGVTRGVYPYTSNYGTVYKITQSGTFTTLHGFTSTDGAWPTGQLVQGKDFYFYGTTQRGGAYGYGTIFRISSSGDFKVLYSFDGATASTPIAGVIQASDGNFYGTALEPGNGAIYRFSLTKGFSILYTFSGASDGGSPYGGLVQATDGYLYGGTYWGGSANGGVLYRIGLDGTYTVIHDCDSTSGTGQQALMVQDTDGLLYSATTGGGSGGSGVIYSIDIGQQPFVSYLPVYGRAGTKVQILGQGFTSDSTVSFNGVSAAFTVVSPTFLEATVPVGAASGYITVTTPDTSMKSSKVFVVHQ